MSKPLAQYVRHELAARGWTLRQLGEKAQLAITTISGVLNNPDRTPDLTTLEGLAYAFEVPLSRLVELAGFALEGPRLSHETQLAMLLAMDPDLRAIVADVAALDTDDLRAIRAYLAGVRALREEQTPDKEGRR